MNLFNNAAYTYDSDFSFTSIGKAQRNLVYRAIEPLLNNQTHNILEINCGTGLDACYFAQKGHTVLATDGAEKMLEISKKNAAQKSLEKNITFKHIDLNQFAASSFNTTFNIVFSNFGGLNCLSPKKLSELISQIHSVLKPNGIFIAVVMPKFCIWETIYFLAKMQPKKAFRRLKSSSTMAHVSGKWIETFYYNPSFFIKNFHQNWQLKKLTPIGFCIPPSYLQPTVNNLKLNLTGLENFDQKLSSIKALSYLSDHFLIALKKLT